MAFSYFLFILGLFVPGVLITIFGIVFGITATVLLFIILSASDWDITIEELFFSKKNR